MNKIVVLDSVALNPGDLSWDGYNEFGEVIVYDRTEPKDVIERIADANIVLTNKTVITRETMVKCPSMKYIGVNATGYNVVDVVAAKELGIVVTNVPEYGTDAVAQFTFALMFEMCNQVGLHNHSVHKGEWITSEDFSYHLTPLMDICGKTLGIVGYGAIGKRVAQIAHSFGMRVIVNTRTKKECPDWVEYVSLDELLAQSDIITLHCPLTDSNKEMICANSIAKMKTGVKLINTARGGLINENDLVMAVKSTKISAAALDVISCEPMKQDNVLLGVDNIIITPHIAWASHEARARLMDVAVDNVRSFLKGNAVNVVNK